MQEKSPGSASRNGFLKFVRCLAAEENNTTTMRTAILLNFIHPDCIRIESLKSEAESSAGKKQILNVSI